MQDTKLYIDLDGVIFRRTAGTGFKGAAEIELAPNALEFLDWAADTYDCYWLTARSPSGRLADVKRGFNHAIPTSKLPQHIHDIIDRIPVAPWDKAKCTGIDISVPFYWIDDMPDQASQNFLRDRGLVDRIIFCNTDGAPEDLQRVWRILEIKGGL